MKRRAFFKAFGGLAVLAKAAPANAALRHTDFDKDLPCYWVEAGESVQERLDLARAEGAAPEARAMVIIEPGYYREDIVIHDGIDLVATDAMLGTLHLQRCASLSMERCSVIGPLETGAFLTAELA